MKMVRLFILLVLACTWTIAPHAIACASASPAPENGCADFLAAHDLKPRHVLFVKCEQNNDRQGKPLTAIYRVAGGHAAAAEAFLARAAHMPRLRKSCCQWDGAPGHFSGKDGRIYMVYMVSAETSIKDRKQWRDISSFEIVVETLTEEI